jgi:NAD(P)-dependent dehydrogenase (short-subunit alcohol dehydrogenase family)
MASRLADKVCIVTGGGMGLGEATCRLFAEQDARVVVLDIDRRAAETVAGDIKRAGGRAIPVEADVSEEDQVRGAIQETLEFGGRIDVLVNNAAVGGAGYNYTVVDAPMDVYDRCLDVNLRGTFLCMKHAIPEMIDRRAGSIVNVGSISSVVGLITQSIYACTKGAILQLTRQAAVDYASNGIRANCVLPGAMDTPMAQREVEQPDNKELIEKELAMLPMGRWAQPREVAFAILFLASDEASFITGASLVADGGYTAQ